jgi:predicted transcriptional regulator
MLDTSRFVVDLCALGLTQYEAKVYLALMQRRFYTAAEVARVSTVPRQRIYDVLSSLFERGLVRIRQGGSMQYTAIDPQQAMDRLMGERRAALEGLERTTTELLAALTPTWSDGQAEADPLNFIEVLRDPHMVAERVTELQRGAQQRLWLMARPPHLTGTGTDQLATTARLRAAGGDVRCIYEAATLADAETRPAIDERVAAGEEARALPGLPAGLCIVDDASALISLRDPVAGADSSTTVLVEHSEMAQVLTMAFESVWARAEPLP